MSQAYRADGKRRSSMTHATRPHKCKCGRIVFGNGYYQHRKGCPVYLAFKGEKRN